MKIAYLVMAHAVDEQLRLLIDRLLEDSRSSVYIHMDRKTADLKWLDSESRPNLHILRNREIVNWGGFSIVRATQNLLRMAVRDPKNERFVLLSGSCFPLLPSPALGDALLAAPACVAVWGKIDASLSRNEGLGRYVVTKAHPLDVTFINPKRGPLRDRLWNMFKAINNRLPYERRVEIDDLWKGSQFFVFDRALALTCSYPPDELVTTLRHALAPDEIFFTTLFVRRQREAGNRLTMTGPGAHVQGRHFIRKQTPMHRTWRQRLAGTVDLRRLTAIDLAEALVSDALFTRKCTPDISRAIIKAADARYHSSRGEVAKDQAAFGKGKDIT
ncbi:hypothetical protein J2D73_17340 [Acetobacter sacchari]|uniref:Glycosyl transferase n=1 Tax=Acetobacter sacchari TaxID=2661687 RepID=A0ABS3M055_9PROT|nr:beta-1,6-N-acetylglucosaminyltransferase [Acetobacter sacchari]MBO1361552.1 hypothetical protein [Acetobacter sacchari]